MTAPFLVMFFLGIVDFSRALWEHNQAMKACQVGVRAAVVSDMIAPGLASFSGVLDVSPPVAPGQPIPIGGVSPNPVICTCANIAGDPPACATASCTAFGTEVAAFNAVIRRMAAVYPRLAAGATVEVTYRHVGLGFSGNPAGPDIWPLTTVGLRGLDFDFTTPAVGAIAPLEFPRCSATLSGEDFLS